MTEQNICTITGTFKEKGILLLDKHDRKKIEFTIAQPGKHSDEATFVAYEGLVEVVSGLKNNAQITVSFKLRTWLSKSGYRNTTLTAVRIDS
jgi:hypothetical protein